jgi:putative sterol carrier protein
MLPGRLVEPGLNDQSKGAGEMAKSVTEFFGGLESSVDESKTAGMNNSYLFDIEGAGQWVVQVEDGKVSVSEGTGEADTTIQATEENFLAISRGELNPTTAYMTGKLKIKGDMGAALKLQKLF